MLPNAGIALRVKGIEQSTGYKGIGPDYTRKKLAYPPIKDIVPEITH